VHADVIDRNNIGMTEGSGSAGLLLETAQAILIMGKRGFEYLEGHIPPQPLIAGAIYFPHPSRTYLFEYSIVAEDFTNHAKAEAAFVGMLGRVRADVNWSGASTCLNGLVPQRITDD
jgi:hypothetical protein